MIKPARGYEVNGHFFTTIEEAQRASIEEMFSGPKGEPVIQWSPQDLAAEIVNKSEHLIDILTTTAKSRPSARKANGGTKTRKPKSVAAQFNEIAQESADVMRQRIADGKGVV